MAKETTPDTIETIQGSLIQHGHYNDRIYVMRLNTHKTQDLIAVLDRLAAEKGYAKIFAKIPAACWKAFENAGYVKEALVPGFFEGKHDGLFIGKFFSVQRQQTNTPIKLDDQERISRSATQAKGVAAPIVACSPADSEALAAIYRRVFESYAFPIHRPEYLQYMMRKKALYFCIRVKQKIVSAAAAEIDSASMSCEMTDFATLPGYRGYGMARRLLGRLDDEAQIRGLKTAYTIARADSKGMNRVFQTSGYRYAGQLIKNTQIAGRIRSMTVWYKRLSL